MKEAFYILIIVLVIIVINSSIGRTCVKSHEEVKHYEERLMIVSVKPLLTSIIEEHDKTITVCDQYN